EFEVTHGQKKHTLHTINVAVKNTNLNGLMLKDVPALTEGSIVCSRLKRGEQLHIPRPDSTIATNDLLHLVGERQALKRAQLVIGEEVDASLSTRGTELRL
ncbi:TrkA C-terminal domain-containing protein, partial [Vibrio harveyi]|uniref:TrkA C-terminal domain-containing protein n=1 Tax=Vibrio harveyi TaxID=669 RepID=UPI002454D7F2